MKSGHPNLSRWQYVSSAWGGTNSTALIDCDVGDRPFQIVVWFVIWRRNQLPTYFLIARLANMFGTLSWVVHVTYYDREQAYHYLLQQTPGDIRLGNIIKGINSFQRRSSCWSLHWVAVATSIWHIWAKRNLRFKKKLSQPAESIRLQFIRDINLIYDMSKFKKPHKSRLEELAHHRWSFLTLLTLSLFLCYSCCKTLLT